MMQICDRGVRRRGISARTLGFVTVAVACAMGAGVAGAQVSHNTGVAVGAKMVPNPEAKGYETLHLKIAVHGLQPNDQYYDIVTDLRNMLPRARIFYVESQRAVSVYGTAEQLALAKRILADVDRREKSYKVTYTLTETGGGQAAKTRNISMLVASGGAVEVKQGERVPIATGSVDSGTKTDTQLQYLDLGLMIRAKLSGGPGHLALNSRVEESRVAKEAMIAGIQEPVIEQTTLTGTLTLVEGKAESLGKLDIPANGSVGARHITVAVTVEPEG
jgi:type II secretory pathway component GspD/PulD (secretin)